MEDQNNNSGAQNPRAILLDMDDTIITDGGVSDTIWKSVCDRFAPLLGAFSSEKLYAAISRASGSYWSDTENHRRGRLDLKATRRYVVSLAFTQLSINNIELANQIADAFTTEKDRAISPIPGAVEAVHSFKERGLPLALITNGASDVQRRKIERFGLAAFFDCILIEEEFGAGKPDERVFQAALDNLKVKACSAWMIGDDLSRDIGGAQKLGIHSIWVDWRGTGLDSASSIQPDRIVRSIAQLS